MGHKKYMLVGYEAVPYEHPPQDSLKSTFFCRFLCSFWWNMLQEANYRQFYQINHFQYGRHEKMPNNEKWEFLQIVTITDKQNLHINVIVENYNEIIS